MKKEQEKSVMNERISVIHYAFFATYVTVIFSQINFNKCVLYVGCND